MNIDFMSHSKLMNNWDLNFTNSFDHLCGKLKYLTLSQRFIGIFSLLFGLSIAIQQENHKKTGVSFRSYFLKRNAVLVLFGILHLLFLFMGDILILYSILSVFLYVLMRFSNKILLTVAGVVYFVPALLDSWTPFREATGALVNSVQNYYTPDSIVETYQAGSLLDMMTARLIEYFHYDLTGVSWNRTALALIITGYVLGREGFHHTYTNYLRKLRIIFLLGLLFYLSFIAYFFMETVLFTPVINMLYQLHILVSVLVYVLGLLFLWRLHKLQPLLSPLSPLGRMSLSNYIFQSVCGALIFTNYGFSLFGMTSPTQNLLIAVGIYLLQLVLSNLYVGRFKTGPLEFLWHKLVY
jgi:uncharacterized protein